MSDPAAGPIFHVEPRRGLGARMIQYLVALRFRSLAPGARISNASMPEWGIDHPPLPPEGATETLEHRIDLPELAGRVRGGAVRRVVLRGHGQRLANLPALDLCRAAFRPAIASPVRFDERHLVCHVRAGKRIYGHGDPSHVLTPVEFYDDVIRQTGLIPVFVGQTAPNDYTHRLRQHFPHARFLETGDAVQDFEILRGARTIAIGVSVFAWLAAWLSHADRIFMAVSGFLNPMQDRFVDLLPFDDPRYRFHLFPVNFAVPVERHAALHARIAPFGRQVPAALLQRMMREAPRFEPSPGQVLEVFDHAWYLKTNRDVAAVYGEDAETGAFIHYLTSGRHERRLPFDLSFAWYAGMYPKAAMEVSQGDYRDLAQHYAAVGRARGHRPSQPDKEPWWGAIPRATLPAKCPAIATLAREAVEIERAAPLAEMPSVRLGKGFGILPPHQSVIFAARTSTDTLHVYHLRDVLLDVSLMGLFAGRQPIEETLYMVSPRARDYAQRKLLGPRPTDPDAHYIVGGNLGVSNYYHWMVQSLPAIDWGLRHRRHPRAVLALPALTPWQADTLALLGHDAAPRLTLEPSTHYHLASAEYSDFLSERIARIVSRAALSTFARLRRSVAPAADGAEAIYVARTDTKHRVALNEDALIAMLRRQGVRIVVPGALPLREQLAAFRAARLVIGPHGAGLSNIVGCEPGTHVYELVPSHYPNCCFNALAQACGLHYWGDVFPCTDDHAAPQDRTWRIDLDLVAVRLDRIRAQMASERARMGGGVPIGGDRVSMAGDRVAGDCAPMGGDCVSGDRVSMDGDCAE